MRSDGSGKDRRPVGPPEEDSGNLPASVRDCLERIAAGDLAARDLVIELCSERLYLLARRMLSRFPRVRRWSDTDDVFQEAAMRLHRALAEVRPESTRGLLALAGTQMHRELVDLARRYASGRSYEGNHGTNVIGADDSGRLQHVVDRAASKPDQLDRWTAFHEAVEQLPPDEREVFDLVWYMGASQETAAGIIGCCPRTVKSRWRLARLLVKAALDGHSPET
jgi:RNA polymerase sigma factor (sigma-70 family)